MNFIFLGAPGAGKGTQAKFLVKKYGLHQVSTGEILREAIKEKTAEGLKAEKFMDKGELVPDNTMIKIISQKLVQSECNNGFILDGFPRTLIQAQKLEEILLELRIKIDKVIYFSISDPEVIKRLSGRRVCSSCGATYHIVYNKPEHEGKCNICLNDLHQRHDDAIETIENRLKIYYKLTAPLINHYKEKGNFTKIDAADNIKDIEIKMNSIVKEKK